VHGGGSVAGMTRTRIALTVTTLGLAGLLGLTACGAGAAPTPASAPASADGVDADLGDEAFALAAVGVETGLQQAPAPAASGAAAAGKDRKDGKARPGAARKLLRKNTLHGEVTRQTKKGTRTVVVQRGTVTASGTGTVTVKSTDGFTQTWTFADKVRVRANKQKVEVSAVTPGAEVGVAGVKAGAVTTARLIVVA
jgi:hypothetical protein